MLFVLELCSPILSSFKKKTVKFIIFGRWGYQLLDISVKNIKGKAYSIIKATIYTPWNLLNAKFILKHKKTEIKIEIKIFLIFTIKHC